MTEVLQPEQIQTASLYPLATLEERTVGIGRILITRYWPRGVKRDGIDDWWGTVAPIKELLKAYKLGAISWETFAILYRLQVTPALDVLRTQAAAFIGWYSAITLLCHEHDAPESEVRCHRRLLRELLLERGEVV